MDIVKIKPFGTIFDIINKYNINIKFKYYQPDSPEIRDITVDGEYFEHEDCSTRSMTCLTNEDYNTILDKQLEYSRRFHIPYNSTVIMEFILNDYGYKPVKFTRSMSVFTIVESCNEEEYIIITDNHAICVKNHTIYDSLHFEKHPVTTEHILYDRGRSLFIKRQPGEENHVYEFKVELDEEEEDG